MKKNLIYYIPTLGKGGAEDIVINLSASFTEKFNVIIIVARRTEGDDYNFSRIDEKIKLEVVYDRAIEKCIIFKKAPTLKILYKSIGLYFKYGFKESAILHVNLTLGSIVGNLWKILSYFSRSDLSVIETFHTNMHLLPLSRKVIFVLGWRFRDVLVYEIDEREKVIIERFSPRRLNLVYIPFAALPVPPRGVAKRSIRRHPNSILLLTVSRLRIFEKRIDSIIEVLKNILARDQVVHHRRFELVLAGDGPDRAEVERIISQENLQDNVSVLGFVDDPELYMQQADFYLCAFVGEDPGISGLQATMMGATVLGVQTVPGYESVTFKTSGQSSELCEMILEFVDSPQEAARYREVTQHHVNRKFGFGDMIARYDALYEESLSNWSR